MPDALLRMRGISKRFGATAALREVDLDVMAGSVLALIGENGAGKSTLMKILSGVHSPDVGVMELSGQPYAPSGPHQARLSGVAMIYQELSLAPDLSVEDNIMLGREHRRWGFLRRGSQAKIVREALELLGHEELRPSTPVRRLSVGARQLVEIARALALHSRLIVFDEPTSSLTRRDVDRLFSVIRKLRSSGVGVIYISHFLEEVREICDRYTVLRDGQTVESGDLQDTTEDRIISLMVGRDVRDLFPRVDRHPGEAVLSLENLRGDPFPIHATLELRRGEVLGIAGLVGAGRTELLRCLFGLDPVRQGHIRIARFHGFASPKTRIRQGVALVSEDRKGEGLALGMSIADNMTLSRMGPFARGGWLRVGKRRARVGELMRRMQVKAAGPDQAVDELSGGNQQKVALARVLHQDADILLLDEPTRGIDVGTKAEIYRLVGEWAAAGKAVIFVSSYLPELLAVCDRLAVMARGRLRSVRPVHAWTEEEVMAQAVAGDAEVS